MFLIIALIFIVGYLCIAFEHSIHIDKTASALVMGMLCWIVFLIGAPHILSLGLNEDWVKNISNTGAHLQTQDFVINTQILDDVGSIAEIIFFLIGAMTIVEIIDRHNGFLPITSRITTKSKVKLLWTLTLVTFFMSSLLDDLTTTIVLISVLRKLVSDKHDRWCYAGMIVLAANAGGAWSPIGDVTTILLWAHGNITGGGIALHLLPACFACVLIPLFIMSRRMKGNIENGTSFNNADDIVTTQFTRTAILCVGVGALLIVPVLKSCLGVPPFMGVFFGLGILWATAELIHHHHLTTELKSQLSIVNVLKSLEISTILFFIGILTAVAALESAGHLHLISEYITMHVKDVYLIDVCIGLLSSIVDNVALVAATMGMYPITDAHAVLNEFTQHFVIDGPFWQLLAFTAGTGGSILIIGSAAGVAVMGLEKIPFIWYLKNISLLALSGFVGGVAVYYLLNVLL